MGENGCGCEVVVGGSVSECVRVGIRMSGSDDVDVSIIFLYPHPHLTTPTPITHIVNVFM